jgi:CHAD domain-containing protein/HD superfamily phosphodiesterase
MDEGSRRCRAIGMKCSWVRDRALLKLHSASKRLNPGGKSPHVTEVMEFTWPQALNSRSWTRPGTGVLCRQQREWLWEYFVSGTLVPSSVARPTRPKKTTGLRYWMLRVLEECERVSVDFGPDPVHDLRVSLRRCRSLADGLMALDPDPDWKAMKKAGKRLFQRLGALRDVHVMMEWVERLAVAQTELNTGERAAPPVGSWVTDSSPSSPGPTPGSADPVALALFEILHRRENDQQQEAQAALEQFDGKQWRSWSKSLPARAGRVRPESALFKHLALERWTTAHELHARALRNRSQVAFHSLRIGIKRFRYIVENFLPVEHRAWSNDLKQIQDWLGEVHDLDVLSATANSCQVFPDTDARNRWQERILSERTKRIDRYRAKMVGPNSLWQVWRAGLPQGKQIHLLATRRMKLWANRLDPDFPHSERVAGLALQLYDGLLAWGWQPAVDAASARSSLLGAALLHDVGKSAGRKGHHKASFDLIRGHGNPLGWKAADLARAAIVARFHCGKLPTRKHKTLRDLLPDEQKATIQLAAVLRLANALDVGHDGHIRRIEIENDRNKTGANDALTVIAEGYSPLGPSAQTIAAERHLLETVLRRPVVFKPLRNRVGAYGSR